VTPEGQLKLAICQYLESRGYCFWVNSAPWVRGRKATSPYASIGVADVIGLTKEGKLFAIEVKAKGGKVAPHQARFLERVQVSKGIAIVAYTLENVSSVL